MPLTGNNFPYCNQWQSPLQPLLSHFHANQIRSDWFVCFASEGTESADVGERWTGRTETFSDMF